MKPKNSGSGRRITDSKGAAASETHHKRQPLSAHVSHPYRLSTSGREILRHHLKYFTAERNILIS